MARKPQVTRTLTTTRTRILCLNVVTGEPYEQEIILPRFYKDEAHVLKEVRKRLESDTVKVAHIISYKIERNLYGMSEERFAELADLLPPRTA